MEIYQLLFNANTSYHIKLCFLNKVYIKLSLLIALSYANFVYKIWHEWSLPWKGLLSAFSKSTKGLLK